MANDHNQRPYRTNDPYGRGGAPAPATPGDPLAELARLIGQNEPFSEYGRDGARRANPRDPRQAHNDPTMDWAAPVPNAQYAAPPSPDSRMPPGAPNYAAADPHFSAPPPGTHHPMTPETQPFNVTGFDQQPYGEQRHDGGPDLYPSGYDGQGYAHAPQDGQGYQADRHYHGGNTELPAEGDDLYDDVPPPRRRGLFAVAAVISLAVIGTAGAFGYRAIFGSSGSAPPPVIKAESTPSKVMPAGQSGEGQANKLIYDRVGDRSRSERVVSREENPVDMKDTKTPPRVIFPGPGNSSSGSPSAAPLPASTNALALTEPKKIRTVTIKPDQPGMAEPAASTTASSASSARSAPTRTASAPLAIMDAGNSAPAPTVAPRPVASRPPLAPSNAPLSLTPEGAASPAPAAPIRTASATPARIVAPPSTATAANGSYAVQISSQRSEAEAQASFQSLQGRFSSVLAGRQPIIRRADLGSKGTYYRAMVGPFATADQANELCSSLKAAGGDCIVQRN